MKVMYVACNPAEAGTLLIEQEVTELQSVLGSTNGIAPEFAAFPKLSVDRFPAEITNQRPDVLHISAHGSTGCIVLGDRRGQNVPLTGELLRRLIPDDLLPKLVYLNACDSKDIAEDVAAIVPMAIGTTANIRNGTALASMRRFYEQIFHGRDARSAFEASRAMVEALDQGECSLTLEHRDDVDPSKVILHPRPKLIARFVNDDFSCDDDGNYTINLGVDGCPKGITQVLFSYDARIGEVDTNLDEDGMAFDACRLTLGPPVRNRVWCSVPDWAYYEQPIYAVGISHDRVSFAISGTLCDAISAHYETSRMSKPDRNELQSAIDLIRNYSG